MSDDKDEDDHFCLRCKTTISGLDAYVEHRKSKRCSQTVKGSEGDKWLSEPTPGPSGIQHGNLEEKEANLTSSCVDEISPHDSLRPSTSQKTVPEVDDYFFSSLCLQSSSKTGDASPMYKQPGVLTRSKTMERSSAKDEKLQSQMEEMELFETNYEDSDSDDSDEGRQSRYPPPTSGGKWLPGFRPQRDTSVLWKSAATPEHSKIVEAPSPPPIVPAKRPGPPPSHTRGKWDSSQRPWGALKKPSGEAFWCGPCNRRLSSRLVYERHIKSELHFKRTNPWSVQTSLGKRTVNRSRAALESSLQMLSGKPLENKQRLRGIKRIRDTIACEVCKYRVSPHLMGKHLISHYHCNHPRSNNEANNAMVLKHIDSIVRQAPFQCGLCKFYCNNQAAFVDHWASEMHQSNDQERAGVYWCANCNFKADSSFEMSGHLADQLHKDRVAIIDLSVPVVIQKITPLQCDVCKKSFRYNAQIRAHSKLWGHQQTTGTASNTYQEAVKCPDCSYRCNSLLSYQRHCLMKHKQVTYFCRRCSLHFKTKAEVNEHRRSAEHRDSAEPKDRPCPKCELIFQKVSLLKIHLEEVHPDVKHRCLTCGTDFTLKQELSKHVQSCKIQIPTTDEPEQGQSSNSDAKAATSEYKCDKCSFLGRTETEQLVHKLLHESNRKCDSGKFVCPYCDKTLNESYVKKHMMTHTSERPYTCEICNFSFARQDTLSRHAQNVHRVRLTVSKQKYACSQCSKMFNFEDALQRHVKAKHKARSRTYQCTECDQAFFEKGTLARHMQTHFGKKFQCHVGGCIFQGRSLGELTIHARTHSDARQFHCKICSYSAKTKNQLAKHWKSVHSPENELKCPRCTFKCKTGTHLKRHLRTHSGSKPYLCPHCSFACTSLDNLRKHIIKSKLHPGKSVYECREGGCSFTANFSKDLKTHLVQAHNVKMSDAIAQVAGIYKPIFDADDADNEPDLISDIPGDGNLSPAVEAEEETLEEFVYDKSIAEVDDRLPTLASVALTPSKTNEEEIVFIHITGSDEVQTSSFADQSALTSFHQSFPIIETHCYDQGDMENAQEEEIRE